MWQSPDNSSPPQHLMTLMTQHDATIFPCVIPQMEEAQGELALDDSNDARKRTLSKSFSGFISAFINRTDVWFQQAVYRDKFGCFCKKVANGADPVSRRLIVNHLSGDITVCVPATNGEGLAKWCAWDSDLDSDHLARIAAVLVAIGFHPLKEGRREGREGHMWLMLDVPAPAADLLLFNRLVCSYAEIDRNALEFFPKSVNKLSQLRLPLGVHRKPEANHQRGWFDGAPKSIAEQLIWFAAQPKNSTERVQRLANAQRIAEANALRQARKKRVRRFANRVGSLEAIDILSLVDARRVGDEFYAQCPACAAEGHDRHADNLRISADGKKFCCVFGGPAATHKSREIVRILSKENR
ncbi:MAG: hypothetical protein K2W95_07170 [Candidatus Obscuribacterales bacterium]|nr:hypothetical protein [Candidatus Obscuribacterales bacterium]